MPKGELTKEPEEIAEGFLKEHPEANYTELPLAVTGCDSYASWHPKFKSLSPVMTVDDVLSDMEAERINGSGLAHNDGHTHLVITGGEPLLGWQRAYPELLTKARDLGYKHITFETNGTQEITDDFADYMLTEQIKSDIQHRFTFSVSPKLTCSGETPMDALKPEIVASYQKFGTVYLKFVVSSLEDMRDVKMFVKQYRECGWHGEVYLMPCGGDPDMYNLNAPEVAKLAMQHGYRYSPRLQVDLWKNEWGT
jgi:7-carboxy-7-deazaguanine synthase